MTDKSQTTDPDKGIYITGHLWLDARALLSHAILVLAVAVAPRGHPFTHAAFPESKSDV